MKIDFSRLKEKAPILFSFLQCLIRLYRKYTSYKLKVKENKIIDNCPIKHNKALRLLEDKKRIRCVFFAIFPQVWKYDYVYKLMVDHPRFSPVILVCPRVNYGYEAMIRTQNECFSFLKNKGYNVIKSYDEEQKRYVNVLDLNPDIIFYTNPYRGLIDDRYFIDNFDNILTVYVPYMFGNNNDVKSFHDQLMHNAVWRFFVESDYHKIYSEQSSRCRGRNVVSTGYPGIEAFLDSTIIPNEKDWKLKNTRHKRIIWAPHHTITPVGNVYYSCFIKYADFMLSMAEKYKDSVQFVFKPHPLLRDKLNLIWGREKTERYYNKWSSLDNCNMNDGDYIDLFKTSDAMIHDSGSFVVEYLYVNKPVMRTLNGESLESMFNTFALRCLDQYYYANCEKDIEQFILNIINNIDPLKEQRTKFVNEVLMPKGSPSQNIIDDILDSIDNQILYRN